MALDRDGLELHYFDIPGFLAEDSYGSCVVITDDIEALFDAFAARLRAAYGKLPVSGFPRITRPRRRKNLAGATPLIPFLRGSPTGVKRSAHRKMKLCRLCGSFRPAACHSST
jgi:hypothetical protein